MSHELRTPLNSLLILSNLLAANQDGNLDEKQVEFAQTIHTAGSDLLALINDILDLSKVEAGKMDVHATGRRAHRPGRLRRALVPPVAEQKGLEFEIEIADGPAGDASTTDEQRLQQIVKNLLSNAFKFTDKGGVTLRMRGGRRPELRHANAQRRRRRDRVHGHATPASASPRTSCG